MNKVNGDKLPNDLNDTLGFALLAIALFIGCMCGTGTGIVIGRFLLAR